MAEAVWKAVQVPWYEHGGYNLNGELVRDHLIEMVDGYRVACPRCGELLVMTRGWYCKSCKEYFETPRSHA